MSTETKNVTPQELPERNKYTPKNLSVEKIIEYRNKGLSYSQIAHLMGCDQSSIAYHLQPIADELDTLEVFKKNKGDILALAQRRILNEINSEKLKEASALQLATTFGVLYDKERLETGRSTSNISVFSHAISAAHNQLLSPDDVEISDFDNDTQKVSTD